MSYERRSFAGGAVETTLTSGISAGDTSASIAASTGWPDGSAGDFFIVIDRGVAGEEKILVDTRSSLTLNSLTRGQDGTSASAHASGATVEVVLTARDLDEANAHVADTTLNHHTQYPLKTLWDANSVVIAVTDNTPVALPFAASRIFARLASGDIVAATVAQIKTLLAYAAADLTDLVPKSLYDANSILAATSDDTPAPLTVGASTIVGRMASGGIVAMSVAEAQTLLGIADTDRAVIGGFLRNTQDIVTNTQLLRVQVNSGGGVSADSLSAVVDRAGSIVGVAVAHQAARAAGSITYEVYKNGTGTGLTVTIDGTNTQYNAATQAIGTDTFVAKDRLDVRGTNSSVTPSSVEAWITVAFS